MKISEEALALRQKRKKDMKAMYDRLNKQQKYTQSQIYHLLSERFYLLDRQIQYILHDK